MTIREIYLIHLENEFHAFRFYGVFAVEILGDRVRTTSAREFVVPYPKEILKMGQNPSYLALKASILGQFT